jgi:hypothetical protein
MDQRPRGANLPLMLIFWHFLVCTHNAMSASAIVPACLLFENAQFAFTSLLGDPVLVESWQFCCPSRTNSCLACQIFQESEREHPDTCLRVLYDLFNNDEQLFPYVWSVHLIGLGTARYLGIDHQRGVFFAHSRPKKTAFVTLTPRCVKSKHKQTVCELALYVRGKGILSDDGFFVESVSLVETLQRKYPEQENQIAILLIMAWYISHPNQALETDKKGTVNVLWKSRLHTWERRNIISSEMSTFALGMLFLKLLRVQWICQEKKFSATGSIPSWPGWFLNWDRVIACTRRWKSAKNTTSTGVFCYPVYHPKRPCQAPWYFNLAWQRCAQEYAFLANQLSKDVTELTKQRQKRKPTDSKKSPKSQDIRVRKEIRKNLFKRTRNPAKEFKEVKKTALDTKALNVEKKPLEQTPCKKKAKRKKPFEKKIIKSKRVKAVEELSPAKQSSAIQEVQVPALNVIRSKTVEEEVPPVRQSSAIQEAQVPALNVIRSKAVEEEIPSVRQSSAIQEARVPTLNIFRKPHAHQVKLMLRENEPRSKEFETQSWAMFILTTKGIISAPNNPEAPEFKRPSAWMLEEMAAIYSECECLESYVYQRPSSKINLDLVNLKLLFGQDLGYVTKLPSRFAMWTPLQILMQVILSISTLIIAALSGERTSTKRVNFVKHWVEQVLMINELSSEPPSLAPDTPYIIFPEFACIKNWDPYDGLRHLLPDGALSSVSEYLDEESYPYMLTRDPRAQLWLSLACNHMELCQNFFSWNVPGIIRFNGKSRVICSLPASMVTTANALNVLTLMSAISNWLSNPHKCSLGSHFRLKKGDWYEQSLELFYTFIEHISTPLRQIQTLSLIVPQKLLNGKTIEKCLKVDKWLIGDFFNEYFGILKNVSDKWNKVETFSYRKSTHHWLVSKFKDLAQSAMQRFGSDQKNGFKDAIELDQSVVAACQHLFGETLTKWEYICNYSHKAMKDLKEGDLKEKENLIKIIYRIAWLITLLDDFKSEIELGAEGAPQNQKWSAAKMEEVISGSSAQFCHKFLEYVIDDLVPIESGKLNLSKVDQNRRCYMYFVYFLCLVPDKVSKQLLSSKDATPIRSNANCWETLVFALFSKIMPDSIRSKITGNLLNYLVLTQKSILPAD